MAHNFKILDGDIYVSKDGSDANDGLTPSTAKKTGDAALAIASGTKKIVVGAGVYKGQWVSSTNFTSITIVGDGKVVLDGVGGTLEIQIIASNLTFENIVFRNFLELGNTRNPNQTNYNGCVLRNLRFRSRSLGSSSNFTKSALIDCVKNEITTDSVNLYLSKLFNSTITTGGVDALHDSYVDSGSTVYLNASDIENSDIESAINIGGTNYELKQKKDGSPADNQNAGIADISTVISDIYSSRASFKQDPLFYNVAKGDYGTTVDITSPLLYAAQNPLESIGDVHFAVGRKITDASFANPASSDDIVTETGDFVVDDASVDGVAVIREAPVQFASKLTEIGLMLFGAALNFDSDVAKGNQENDNVLAVENYATGTAGANPRRLTYKMRWSTQETMPATDAEWDNQGYTAAAGDFAVLEVDTVPTIDLNGNGNGEPEHNTTTAGNIAAIWVQREIVIRNGLG